MRAIVLVFVLFTLTGARPNVEEKREAPDNKLKALDAREEVR